MTRETLDNKIRSLLDGVLLIDSMVESATLEAVQALKQKDLEAARRIYYGDAQVNAKRFELENDCMLTITTQQPIMATDLRQVASILEVVGELERMGDYAKGIARICLRIGNQPHIKPIVDLPRMAQIAVDMVHRAVGAFVAHDVDQARLIPQEDDQVDELYQKVYRDLVGIMLTDPTTIDQANLLMWAAHNLERMADRVTNICERTIYVVTNELKEIDASDDESMKI
jgi:phosphate transport system protein